MTASTNVMTAGVLLQDMHCLQIDHYSLVFLQSMHCLQSTS